VRPRGCDLLAVLLLIAGPVLTSNANFANDYVRDQLSQQNIMLALVLAFAHARHPCEERAGTHHRRVA
jgi:hypothetical protein